MLCREDLEDRGAIAVQEIIDAASGGLGIAPQAAPTKETAWASRVDFTFPDGRTTLEAPDIDPVVFVTEDKTKGLPPIEPGQMRRCNVIGSSLFDLEAQPIV